MGFLFSRSAAAAEGGADPDPTASHALSIETPAGLAWIMNQNHGELFAPHYFVGLAPSYRISRGLSLGGIVSKARPIGDGGGLRLWRLAGEARFHAVRTRALDVWGGGEVGVTTDAHVAPLLGAALGLEILPSPYFSIGLEGRALVIVFGATQESSAPSGVSPAIFAGLTLGAHLPVD
jgi:hypothetical protein